MDHKRFEQTVLCRRKLYVFPAKTYGPTDEIDGELAGHENWPSLLLTDPAQGCSDTRQELARPKRLGQIVIRAGVQRSDLLGLITLHR